MKNSSYYLLATTCICIFFSILDTAKAQQNEVHVKWAGEMRKVMHKNDLTANISLDTLLTKQNIIAIGPAEGLKGEVTVINSKPYITKPKGITAITENKTDTKAAFLVYSQVKKWKEFAIPSFVRTQAQLDEFVEKTAKEDRFEMNKPFPFLVKGEITSARIHVVNKTTDKPLTHKEHELIKSYYEPTNTSVQIVGFYSTKHQGIFTHHDSFTHAHLVTADEKLSGHLDALQLKPGKSVLYLPDLPESQRKQRIKLEKPQKSYKDPTY